MEERARHPPRAKLGTHSVSALAPSAQRGKRGPRESAIWGCTVRQLQCQAHPQASPSLRPMQAAELTHGDRATHHHHPRRLRGPSNCRRDSRGSSACSCSHEPGASWGDNCGRVWGATPQRPFTDLGRTPSQVSVALVPGRGLGWEGGQPRTEAGWHGWSRLRGEAQGREGFLRGCPSGSRSSGGGELGQQAGALVLPTSSAPLPLPPEAPPQAHPGSHRQKCCREGWQRSLSQGALCAVVHTPSSLCLACCWPGATSHAPGLGPQKGSACVGALVSIAHK